MKVSEFVKRVVIPVVSALFLAALFRPLCMENGECNYLNLWWAMGIPFGIHRMFFWVIPNPDKPEKFFCISSKFQVQ